MPLGIHLTSFRALDATRLYPPIEDRRVAEYVRSLNMEKPAKVATLLNYTCMFPLYCSERDNLPLLDIDFRYYEFMWDPASAGDRPESADRALIIMKEESHMPTNVVRASLGLLLREFHQSGGEHLITTAYAMHFLLPTLRAAGVPYCRQSAM